MTSMGEHSIFIVLLIMATLGFLLGLMVGVSTAFKILKKEDSE